MWSILLCFTSVLVLALANNDLETIRNERTRLMDQELKMMVGSDIILSDTEEKANEIIMEMKTRDLDIAFADPQYFNMSNHFFSYKDEVKKSHLFKFLQKMPKGAVLHVHDTGLLSPDYVLELTYLENLFVCFDDEDVHLIFSKDVPKNSCATQWQLLRDARFSSGNVEKFDANLRKHFTIVVDDPSESYPNINFVWKKFQQYFITTGSFLCYKPVWEKYFYDTLKAFREENIMYLEIRSVLPYLYDLEGNVYDSVETAKSYKKVAEQFMKDYPDFFGVKLIYAPLRMVDADGVKDYISIARKIKEIMPDFLAGFDLVGQEDLGVPTRDFLKELTEASKDLDFLFHAGETNWSGTSSDENLFDAILLGARRIGHAFALNKHPVLLEEVRKRDIALEVNVLSNSVLMLVEDVRNHPLASFLAQGLPVVISSDDPGVWEAEPITHDFYVTFVGVASKRADLRLLKKLALNSLYYSTFHNKDKIIHEFEIRWTKFIDSFVRNY